MVFLVKMRRLRKFKKKTDIEKGLDKNYDQTGAIDFIIGFFAAGRRSGGDVVKSI